TLKDVLIYAPTIVWVKKGQKLVFWRGQTLEFTKDFWFVTSGNQHFSFSNKLENGLFVSESLSFYSHPSVEYIDISKRNGLKNNLVPLISIDKTMAFLFDSLASMKDLDNFVQEEILNTFYLHLARSGYLHYLFVQKDSISERVVRILSVDPGKNYNIEYVANCLGFSRATLARKLAKENTSFRKIQIDIRMTYSLCLLRKSPVNDVAIYVGYSSINRFCQRFKIQFGLTPYEYIKLSL
ncbi:helix-turn-helix domain-containing protein, partial [Vibrio cholerae]|nr:helix-turn-helix domain-containing protein [Vibrio cholerae]